MREKHKENSKNIIDERDMNKMNINNLHANYNPRLPRSELVVVERILSISLNNNTKFDYHNYNGFKHEAFLYPERTTCMTLTMTIFQNG